MTNGYNSPSEAPDYIISARSIIYNNEAIFSRIYELSEAAINEEDLGKIDRYLLEIYNNSIKLQRILLNQDRLQESMSSDFKRLEERSERVYRLCEYLSKKHDIKAHRDIFKTNNLVIILTVILVYDAIFTRPEYDFYEFSIRIDTLLILVFIVVFFIFNYRPPRADTNTSCEISTNS